MKLIYVVIVLLLWMPTSSMAMEHLSRTLISNAGKPIAGATVHVYVAGTLTLATLYSDNGVTTKQNPFTTSLDGVYDFYAANNVYDITFSHASYIAANEKTKRIGLYDPTDGISSGHRVVNGAGYTMSNSDRGLLLSLCNGDEPMTILFPAPSGSSFANGWTVRLQNICDGTVTINVNQGAAIDGQQSNTLLPSGSGMYIVSNGTTYYSERGSGGGIGGVTGWPNILTAPAVTSETAGQSVSIRGPGIQALNGEDAYQGSDGKFYRVCVVGNIRNACHYDRQLAVGFSFRILNNAGSQIFAVAESGIITTATFDCTLTSVTCTTADEQHYRVATCQNGTAYSNLDIPATAFPVAVCDPASNTYKAYLAFDADVEEAFQDSFILKAGFVSLNVHFRWSSASTTGSVGWCAQLARVPVGGSSNPAFPALTTANCVSDTANGTTLTENAATITGVTCTSCVAGDHVYLRLSRHATGVTVSDSMTGDARLFLYGRTMVAAQ